MNEFYLLDYLSKDNADLEGKIKLLKYELDQRIYYYGEHFKFPKETELLKNKRPGDRLKFLLKNIYIFCSLLGKKSGKNKTIISNAYFSVNNELENVGIKVLRPMHNPAVNKKTVGNYKILRKFISLDKEIKRADFKELISDEFFKEIDLFVDALTDYYQKIGATALIIPNDIAFFEQLNIQAFKKIGKPSFIFLHGLPGRYNAYDENQSDYLVVWSEKIKQNYIKVGFKPEKILVSGHPDYENLSSGELRNDLSDVLVISKSLNGSQYHEAVVLADRGGLIVYLNQIEIILKSKGVERARLRVHPSENINWYYKFINKDFFIEDNDSLKNSLQKATLVIGPTSTVFLESIYYGVNYLVFEPLANGLDLSGYPLVPPFDKLNLKVLVANNEAELERFLEEKSLVDKTIFNDYINSPFDTKCIIDTINLSINYK